MKSEQLLRKGTKRVISQKPTNYAGVSDGSSGFVLGVATLSTEGGFLEARKRSKGAINTSASPVNKTIKLKWNKK